MMVRTEYQSLQIEQARERGVDLERSPDGLTHRAGKEGAASRARSSEMSGGQQLPVMETAPSLPNNTDSPYHWHSWNGRG